MLKIREINDYSEFKQLRELWNDLLAKSDCNSAFLTWEWLLTWWRHFGKGRELVILLAQEDEDIIAAAPLMYSNYDLTAFKIKKMEFLGTEHTDYRNFVLTRRKVECMKSFMNHIYNLNWDFLHLKQIPETASSVLSLSRICDKNFLESRRVSGCSFYIPLCASVDEFWKKQAGTHRHNIRRRLRRLKENFDISYERCNSINSLPQAIDTLINLHQKRWALVGEEGSFRSDLRFAGFLLDVSKAFVENGRLHFSFMKANAEPVSAAICFEYNNTFYYYHSGYDPSYSRFGVGSLLIAHLIEEAIHDGMSMFDFLNGAEAYKRNWTSLMKNYLEFQLPKNRFLPTLYDKITRTREYDRLRNSQNDCLRNVKNAIRRFSPSIYGALS
jgi:CelD/BcsL family acetyltransferase involved in cellulose biosynthesis